MTRRYIPAVLACLLLCPVTAAAGAREPAAALTLLNPYPATGAVDLTGTVVAGKALRAMQDQVTPSTTDALVQLLRQALVGGLETAVEVRRQPRGGGEAAALLTAAADDAVVLFAGSGLAAAAALHALRRLQPVAMAARVPTVLVSHAGNGAAEVAQLIARAPRAVPSQFGIAGERTVGAELLDRMQRYWPRGLIAVAYNGGNGALRGVLARQVPAALVPLPAALPYAASSRLRLLAIAATGRHAALPAVLTFAEAGLDGLAASGWHGLFVSANLPAADITRMRLALAKSLAGSASREAISALGYVPDYRGAEALRMALDAELRRTSPDGTGMRRIAALSARFPPAVSPR